MADLKALSEHLISGKADEVRQMTQQAIDAGIEPQKILNEGLIAGMNIVGDKFKKNEFYLPEVLIAARAMHAGMAILKPLLSDTGVKPVGTLLIATVKGDLHDIGKNLVAMMMEGAGFEVVDLKVDAAPEVFVSAIKEHQPDIVGMSALLTTTMVVMKDIVEAIEEAGLREKLKVMIGGAPITQRYADEIGADGYAPDAATAVEKARELLGV